eukprot:831928-Pelagomonas_calceolata.AAC.1
MGAQTCNRRAVYRNSCIPLPLDFLISDVIPTSTGQYGRSREERRQHVQTKAAELERTRAQFSIANCQMEVQCTPKLSSKTCFLPVDICSQVGLSNYPCKLPAYMNVKPDCQRTEKSMPAKEAKNTVKLPNRALVHRKWCACAPLPLPNLLSCVTVLGGQGSAAADVDLWSNGWWAHAAADVDLWSNGWWAREQITSLKPNP